MWLSCITNFQGGLASRKMTAVIGWKNHHPTILHKPSFLLSLSTNFGAFSLIRSSWQPQPSQPVQPVRSEQVNRCQWQKKTRCCAIFVAKLNFNLGTRSSVLGTFGVCSHSLQPHCRLLHPPPTLAALQIVTSCRVAPNHPPSFPLVAS